MWYVYILQDENNKLYIGSTNDLKKRMNEHLLHKNKSTVNFKNIKLNVYIAVQSENIARNLEKYFKTGSGKALSKKRILSIDSRFHGNDRMRIFSPHILLIAGH